MTGSKEYLADIFRLQRCLEVVFLDPEFREKELDREHVRDWLLYGTEKSPRKLRAFCQAWQVSRTQERVTVRVNVMNGGGGVERWTFGFCPDKTPCLEYLEVQRLRENNTFFNQRGNVMNLVLI